MVSLVFLGSAAVLYFISRPNDSAKMVSPGGRPVTAFGWPARATALAGDGKSGFADGEARLARFADPFGLAVDRQGNLYIADAGDNNRIRKMSSTGVVTTFAG